MNSLLRSPKYDVITFGDMAVDLIVNGKDVVPQFGQVEKLIEDYTLEMGGSCCIFACQAARLGLRVGIMGRLGKDSFGDLIISRLQEYGVDTHYVIVDPDLKTGLGIALCPPGDRAILTYMGTINATVPQDVTEEFLTSGRHLHHGSYFLQTQLRPRIPAVFQWAHQLGLTTSLDTNWDPEERWGDELAGLLPWVDVFMPNEQEALRISGSSTLEASVKKLHAMGTRLVTVKCGADGALISDGLSVIRQSVEPVSEGDSIGAGDSFDAGFLAGWMRGMPLEDCLHIGCQCGRSVAAKVGGIQGQPIWVEIGSE